MNLKQKNSKTDFGKIVAVLIGLVTVTTVASTFLYSESFKGSVLDEPSRKTTDSTI